ncbi:MAG: DUF1553 domain-containing protein [Planctomyces sp.]|nr:DUF1553 domain-containing protein [Planctomyces sp.]
MSAFRLWLMCGILVLPSAASAAGGGGPDYTRDIRPILAGRCFKCHGPDEATREAGLRLDVREDALRTLDSESAAIVPGDPDASGLLARVRESDPDLRMPPASEGPPLSEREVDLLSRWIAAGGAYARHWSYVAPVRPDRPKGASPAGWSHNAIDDFVLDRLVRESMEPQAEADRATLMRRVSLDLTGLPPAIEDVDAFLRDERPDAYERLVDRLLASPAYGERWGRVWLDLARYADSAGYADDPPRVIWRYRDWVIDALNSGMPFDQFSIEQIAGDLLADPGESQIVATGFHRNTMTNSEGGTDDEEFRNVAIVDRANTTLQVWMATTLMCAQCHTHKYDPITQHEYFQVFAILNQTEDADRRDEAPLLEVYTADQLRQRDELRSQIASLESELAALPLPAAALPEGPLEARYVRIELPGTEKILSLAEVQAFRGDENIARGKAASQSSTAFGGPAERAVDGNTDGNYNNNSTTHTATESDPWWEVDLGEAGSIDRIVIWNRTDGGIGGRLDGFRMLLLDESRRARWVRTVSKSEPMDGRYDVPADIDGLNDSDREELIVWLQLNSPEHAALRDRLTGLQKRLAGIGPVTTPVMRELRSDKRRVTRVQIRGNFLDLGDEVQPGVPSVFHPLDGRSADGAGPTRLDLARWLVDRRNPLTARVLANRVWEQLFGIGIVETSEEFGLQGDLPTHPELLDWMAVDLMDGAWDVKRLIREVVTSSTYRQSSSAPEELIARDPNNRLLGRGPRFRLEAELVRDQALFVAGLLSDKMHGPSVKPPRPRLGLSAAFGASTDWDASQGEDRFRRGVYTFWQRSLPYPSMDTFDAPSREVCTVRRTRTNTPLQALVTLNDPVYVEASQGLARRVLREVPDRAADGADPTPARLDRAFRLCLARSPSSEEVRVLSDALKRLRERFARTPEEALVMATDPIGPLPEGGDAAELAAWSVLGNVLLNLDETLTRR